MQAFVLRRAAPFVAAVFLAAVGAPGAFAQEGLGSSFTGLQLDGDQPISIESNLLDVDDAQAVATFTGNVAVAQGDTELRSGKLVVHYKKPEDGEAAPARGGALPGGSNQIDRLEATGKVYVKSVDQVATAEQASFDMTSQLVVMTGNVVLSQGENIAEGCKLTIQMDTGLARLESACGEGGSNGRVRLMLSPDGQSDGAATN
ncbi:MAG: lipopolysaccharide transport periplasmic protein LptA [Aurantimonas endophytica]|uniref:Lipopolysaccharide export system protein LptA n=1 Tax=Aurantimonas endophytica TaxID=1522175 RepID=A0A7W6HHH5_9HYPH|nr:lipopolysaccharide transport periplasmic protein LptA [Aurantimonas endophytica]MBB4005289.1 lipopolysaccharide export system protein LptA [Aurantimonas endophytica]MCO6406049.1 lipopolysaccharide transport periplasmic protein LptA [Aurantimonas endophytica]